MKKFLVRIFSFICSTIPFTSLFLNKDVGDDVTVTVSEFNQPVRRMFSTFLLFISITISCAFIYASFIYFPSLVNYGVNNVGDDISQNTVRKRNPYFISESDTVFGAPFSFDWNMSIKEVSQISFLAKKPLVCNGLSNGLNGKVECYFNGITEEDLDRSYFFKNDQMSETRNILVGSNLRVSFEDNKLVGIGYSKKFGDDNNSAVDFYNDSSRIKVLIMDAYEELLSENTFASKNSHHFVTLNIDDSNREININYTMYDNYRK